jgi:hypothetical protein
MILHLAANASVTIVFAAIAFGIFTAHGTGGEGPGFQRLADGVH